MKIPMTICALTMAGALAACASPSADVRAQGGLSVSGAAGASYRFAHTPVQDEQAAKTASTPQTDAGATPSGETLLRAALAQRGFEEAGPVPLGAPDTARYLVSAAWASRPADVTVAAGNCTGGCVPTQAPSLPWFGHPYVHSLTLRFFTLADGHEAYKVSAVKRDRNADAQQALPYLVASALAQLPYAGASQWRVTMKPRAAEAQTATQAMPDVISVTPQGQ
ncbi:DUF4136 domain-containing protein [Paraburkholderia sp.]|uniref:DUF4136 domain-containing protein n=1 Tax=Paraburkholderia sp. TaxID=1926495 RepID=UPI00286F5949|nr:DUF4136 domain-containing protein [Paraburkholderia sp.]